MLQANRSLRSSSRLYALSRQHLSRPIQSSLIKSHIQTKPFSQSVTTRKKQQDPSSSASPSSSVSSIATESKTIANKQKLYVIDQLSPGSIFFLPNGTRIFNRLIEFMRAQQRCYGFEEVITPLIYKDDLWKTSGHWQHYKDDMFQVSANHHTSETPVEQQQQQSSSQITESNNNAQQKSPEEIDQELTQIYGLKPMNCPGHCVMFGKHDHSFRDLPIRFSDFSPLHRNETSGALSGLTRVRKFHQDDGHIFCQPSQIKSEIKSCLNMIESSYSVFGLKQFRLALSTRPDSYAGELSVWDHAEQNLKEALEDSGKDWFINPGDGAFYGPKIDILVKDNNGKEHQTATIQLDFQLPKNFNLKYVSGTPTEQQKQQQEEGKTEELLTPVLIHRAVFGSLERFMAILLDHYQGKWPFWLNPRQAIIIPVADRHKEYAFKVYSQLSGKYNFKYTTELNDSTERAQTSTSILPALLHSRYFNVDLSATDETVGAKTRRAISDGYNFIVVIGDKEVENNQIAVRSKDSRQTQLLTVEQLKDMFSTLEDTYQ